MTTVYTTDDQLIYAGPVEIDPDGPLPPHSTLTAPPATTGNQVALLDGGGWVVLAARPPVPSPAVRVPASVTMRQARLALLGAGLLDDVDAAIASIPDPVTRRAAQIEWEFSNEVQRFNEFTSMLGSGLGLSAAQIDQLFLQAVTL